MFTCSDDFLYLHTRDVDLFGKLMNGVVGVLVSEGVDVDFDSRGNYRRKMTDLYCWLYKCRQRQLETVFQWQDILLAFID